MNLQEYSEALDKQIDVWKGELDKDLHEAKQAALIVYAIENQRWMYIEYTDRKDQFTARLVRPIEFKPKERNGIGFLANCEMREADFRHFKLKQISKMVIVEDTVKWERN